MSRKRQTQSLTGIGLIVVVILAIYSFLSGGGGSSTVTPTAQLPSMPTVSGGGSTGGDATSSWLKIYFTNPNPPDQVGSGIDQFVVPEINNAQKTIDITSFDLNLPSIVNALVADAQRGVQIRVVYDGKNGSQTLAVAQSPTGQDFNAITVLKGAGIQLVDGGRSSGLMHNKMIIIDGRILFMGSWNMSYNDTFRNNNNLLEITNPTLIANYQAKFDELVAGGHFGTHATVGAQTPQLTIGGVQVLNYFSPVDNVADKLVALVNGAQHSVRFMIFTYTDKNLAAAMISRYQAGVDVAGVIENRGASQGAFVPLFCAKVPVKLDGNKYTMHHKVIVIDGNIVVTGSFNFTKSADTENDDNLLVIYDQAVAKQYLDEFDRINALAKDPDPANTQCP
jgi:phosphatidylserine/phosphatidylglycerophosphate/cardiolipin synthase-like enzyme